MHESDGVSRRSLARGGVQGNGVAGNLPRQRGLSRLPGNTDQNVPDVLQGFPDPAIEEAKKHEAALDCRPFESWSATN